MKVCFLYSLLRSILRVLLISEAIESKDLNHYFSICWNSLLVIYSSEKLWQGRKGSNLRVLVSKTSAVPLGYSPTSYSLFTLVRTATSNGLAILVHNVGVTY
jgi:hypothetical protein